MATTVRYIHALNAQSVKVKFYTHLHGYPERATSFWWCSFGWKKEVWCDDVENSGTDCDCRSELPPPLYTPEETTLPWRPRVNPGNLRARTKVSNWGNCRDLFLQGGTQFFTHHKQGPSRVPTTGEGQNSVCIRYCVRTWKDSRAYLEKFLPPLDVWTSPCKTFVYHENSIIFHGITIPTTWFGRVGLRKS